MLKVIPFILVLLLVSCTKSPNVKSLLGTSISEKRISDFIDRKMEKYNMPAISLAIMNDSKLEYQIVKGYADKENKILADDTSIFEGASISKSIFAYFVLSYVEDGLITLDTPLYKYLPNPDISHDNRYKKITARMVLSHRAGFPNWRDDYPEKKLFIQFEPGSDYHYSGEGYQYLAEVLKHLLKTNWAGLEEEFQKRVARPLQMEHTKFIKDSYIRAHKVKPYDESGMVIDKSKDEWWRSRDTVFVAPTTIHTEAHDFSKWIIAMMNQTGLEKTSFNELLESHSHISSGILNEDYTLGFTKLSISSMFTVYAHNGNNTGFSSYFMFDPSRKWGFVFLTNCPSGDEFAKDIIYNLLLTGWSRKSSIIFFSFLLVLLIVLSLFFLKSRFST